MISQRTLTFELIGVAAGLKRPVFVDSTNAKRWGLHPGSIEHGEEHVTADYENAPQGTLFLIPAEGVPGYRVRSKSESGGQSDELYSQSASQMESMLQSAKWAARSAMESANAWAGHCSNAQMKTYERRQIMEAVADRLEAWAETHEMRARNLPDSEAVADVNTSANYRNLIALLRMEKAPCGPCGDGLDLVRCSKHPLP